MDLTMKQYLQSEVGRKNAEANAIVTKADSEGRLPTEDEKKSVRGLLDEAKNLRLKIAELDDNDLLREAIEASGGVTGDKETKARSIGAQFVNSPQFKAMKGRFVGDWSTGAVDIKSLPTDAIGETDTAAEISTDGSTGIITTEAGIRPQGEYPLSVADLIPSVGTSGNMVKYMVETVFTSGADETDEGADKPATDADFEWRLEPVVKLATFLGVSDEMLEDIPGFQGYLNTRLLFKVRKTEEAKLLNGSGDLKGIFTRSIGSADAGDIGGDNAFDAVLAGITQVRLQGDEPDAAVFNPTDFAQMSIAKSGLGVYFSGGPYAPPSANPWGLRTVLSAAVPAGHVLVGAFRAESTLYRRSGLSIELSNSHSDWFRKNVTAVRAETRLALAIYRPSAFVDVTLPTS